MSKFQNGDIVVVRQDCGQRVKYRINGMEFVLGLRDKVQVMWYVNSTRVLVDGLICYSKSTTTNDPCTAARSASVRKADK